MTAGPDPTTPAILWLEPETDESALLSLHRLGDIQVFAREPLEPQKLPPSATMPWASTADEEDEFAGARLSTVAEAESAFPSENGLDPLLTQVQNMHRDVSLRWAQAEANAFGSEGAAQPAGTDVERGRPPGRAELRELSVLHVLLLNRLTGLIGWSESRLASTIVDARLLGLRWADLESATNLPEDFMRNEGQNWVRGEGGVDGTDPGSVGDEVLQERLLALGPDPVFR